MRRADTSDAARLRGDNEAQAWRNRGTPDPRNKDTARSIDNSRATSPEKQQRGGRGGGGFPLLCPLHPAILTDTPHPRIALAPLYTERPPPPLQNSPWWQMSPDSPGTTELVETPHLWRARRKRRKRRADVTPKAEEGRPLIGARVTWCRPGPEGGAGARRGRGERVTP